MGEKLSERMEFRVTPTTKEIIKKYAEVDETSMGETARSLIKIGIGLVRDKKETLKELKEREKELEERKQEIDKKLKKIRRTEERILSEGS